MATYSGGNNCALRYRKLATSGVEVMVEEDTTWDTETEHWSGEAVAYLAPLACRHGARTTGC